MAAHRSLARLTAAAAIAGGLATAPAQAQEIGQEALSYLGTYAFLDSLHTWDVTKLYNAETVLDHTREGFLPAGLVLPAGHMLYPAIAATTMYDDNIFLTPDKIGDLRTTVTPSFLYQANLPRHMFQVHGDAEIVNFSQHSNLDFVNANLKADWRIDIDAADTLGGTFQTRIGHDDNFLPIEPGNPSKALPILSNRAAFGYSHDAGRTAFATGIDWEHDTYLDVPSYSGTNIDESINDNTVVGGFALLTYRWSPGYRAFWTGRIDRQIMSKELASYADNYTYRTEAGLVYELDPLLQFTLYGGYEYIKFDDPSQANVGTPTVRLSMQWLPMQRMTVNFDIGQHIQRTVDGPSFGEISDTAHGRLQYDIWHNLLGTLDATYENDQYIGSPRQDQLWSASAGLEYLFNENLALTLSYQHSERASNESQYDYSDNRYLVSLKLSK